MLPEIYIKDECIRQMFLDSMRIRNVVINSMIVEDILDTTIANGQCWPELLPNLINIIQEDRPGTSVKNSLAKIVNLFSYYEYRLEQRF